MMMMSFFNATKTSSSSSSSQKSVLSKGGGKRRLFDESSFEAFASNKKETKSERVERERERVHFWSALIGEKIIRKKIGKKNWKEKNR